MIKMNLSISKRHWQKLWEICNWEKKHYSIMAAELLEDAIDNVDLDELIAEKRRIEFGEDGDSE